METRREVKFQNLMFGEDGSSFGEHSRNLYYRSEEPVRITMDNGYLLKKDNSYDFFTFKNSLSLAAWKKYTDIKNIFLEVEAVGNFEISLLGYYKTADGIKKEWHGIYTFELEEKSKIKIPFHENIVSTNVGFIIHANEDTVLYEAAYTADVAQNNEVVICIHTAINDKINNVLRNIEIINGLNEDVANRFSLFVEDSNNRLADNCSGNEIIISKSVIDEEAIGAILSNREATHYIKIDEDTMLSCECLYRLYMFLTMVKVDYISKDVAALMMSIFNPNMQSMIDVFSEKGVAGIKTEALDMNIWDNIIESEDRFQKLEDSKYKYQWGFVCKKVTDRKISFDEVLETTNPIVLNAFTASSERKKKITDLVHRVAENESVIRIQDVIVKLNNIPEETREMYYRSESSIFSTKNQGSCLSDGAYYDFFTYFNSLSYAKWRKYTSVNKLYLYLDIEGDFNIDLFGHCSRDNNYRKEWYTKTKRHCPNREQIVVELPNNAACLVAGFGIFAERNVKIYDAAYLAKVKKTDVTDPKISLVTTTFKKEDYIKRNVELLEKRLFEDKFYNDKFYWYIIDNGRSLDVSKSNDHISILPNPNVGGAGGFARGMIESLREEGKYSHILLMDDDVLFMPESFKRLYWLLALLKEDYKNYIVSGAMLEMEAQNIQHEDIGLFNAKGEHGPVKCRWNLNLWDSIVNNEEIVKRNRSQYSGWWFCCLPTTIARKDNLPMPCFFRGDDVEYSIRNNTDFITMNGICIWHQGFGSKFSAAVELYQVHRNDLILQSWNREVENIAVIPRMQTLFWEELYKFNYKGATLILDAIEDYLKGPEFLRNLDGSEWMKIKRQQDNEMLPMTDEIRAMIPYDSLYEWRPLSKINKLLYDYTCNGQKRLHTVFNSKKTGVIPYGWGYYQEKMYFCNRIVAVDVSNDCYVIYNKDINKFNNLSKRYYSLINKYNENKNTVADEWQNAMKEYTSIEFWTNYLGIEA